VIADGAEIPVHTCVPPNCLPRPPCFPFILIAIPSSHTDSEVLTLRAIEEEQRAVASWFARDSKLIK
jgi:hypothetical protein